MCSEQELLQKESHERSRHHETIGERVARLHEKPTDP